MRGEQNRHKNGSGENHVLADLHNGWRDKQSATHVESVQSVGQPVWRKHHCGAKPNHAHREIEAARKRIKRSRFRVVDATKPVGLHQSVPDAPEENYQQNSFKVPPEKSDADYEQKQRRENKAPFEAIEQSPITVGTDHAWQVMPHGTKRSDKQVNVLRTPPCLGQRKRRYEQQRCADVQDQVTPGTEYPQLRPGGSGWLRWRGLQT